MDQPEAICTICSKKQAFHFRVYSGEKLCVSCFTKSIERKVRATIAKHKMVTFGEKIVIAVSGGKDSLSLLKIISKIKKFSRDSIVAVTVDEGIKGYRDEALEIAKKTCQTVDINQKVVSFKKIYGYTLDEIVQKMKANKSELTPCAFCGVLRRKALNIAAIELEANKLATGHTLDDEIQTSMLNIFHGDISRLAIEKPITQHIHPRLVQKIKPLCEIPESESALYAYVKGLDFQINPCPYASDAMRNDIRVLLNRMEDRHAGTKFTVYKSLEKIQPLIVNLKPNGKIKACKICNEPASGNICMACQLINKIQ